MKKYAICIMIVLCPILIVRADVINGFLQEKLMLEKQILSTEKLLAAPCTQKEIRSIKRKLHRLQKKYEEVMAKYHETEQLIRTVELIDPELFRNVSNVTNLEGTLTHVFVRYVNRTSREFTYFTDNFFKANAYTSVRPSEDNEHVCLSLYGTNSITVTVGKGCDALFALGHEFAHVLYIVPNLAEYVDFIQNNDWHVNNKFAHGHSPFDPGFAFINKVEEEFKKKYREYLRNTKYMDSLSMVSDETKQL